MSQVESIREFNETVKHMRGVPGPRETKWIGFSPLRLITKSSSSKTWKGGLQFQLCPSTGTVFNAVCS